MCERAGLLAKGRAILLRRADAVRWALLALTVAASFGVEALAKAPAPTLCAGILAEGDGRILLLSVAPAHDKGADDKGAGEEKAGGRGPDEVRITLPSRELAAAASNRDRTPGWTMNHKGSRLIFSGPAMAGGLVELGVDLPAGPVLSRLEVRGFAGGKEIFDPLDATVEPLPRWGADLLRLPLLITPGETIVAQRLGTDSCWTPPGGSWDVAGAAARPDPEDADRLRIELPEKLDPRGPIVATFHLASGEKTAVRSFDPAQEPIRVAPPYLDEGPPRLGTCGGSRTSKADLLCVCGWFPDAAARRDVWVDGQAQEPVAASSRSLCYQLGLGEHRFTGAPGSPLADAAALEQQRVSVEPDGVAGVKVGRTRSVHWTVTGTREPVELRIKVLTPGFVRAEGGPFQTIRTSGGDQNRASLKVRGLVQGSFSIHARIADDSQASGGENLALLARFAHQVLKTSEVRFRQGVAQHSGRSEDGSWLPGLVRETRNELLAGLRYPELAPLYDYTAAVFAEIESKLARRSGDTGTPEIVRQAARIRDHGAARHPARQITPPVQPGIRQTQRRGEAATDRDRSGPDADPALIARVFAFFADLLSDPIELTRDIRVLAVPARDEIYFRLFPKSFPSDWRGGAYTELPIGNLFLGKYTWQASRNMEEKDPKIFQGEINLLRDQGNTLCCSARSKKITCKWKPEDKDDCSKR